MADRIDTLLHHYLDNPLIYQHERMTYFAVHIYAKCSCAQSVRGLFDGTPSKTCRPSFFQKLLFSGHKRAHRSKLQSVVLPDEVFDCMLGLLTENRLDSFMLAKSHLIRKLRQFMPEGDEHGQNANGKADIVFSLYGVPRILNQLSFLVDCAVVES